MLAWHHRRKKLHCMTLMILNSVNIVPGEVDSVLLHPHSLWDVAGYCYTKSLSHRKLRFQASWKEQAIPNSKWGHAYAEGRNSVGASVSLFYCFLESNDTINGKRWTSGITRTWSNWVGHVMAPVSMTSYENYWKDVQRNNISAACTIWFCQWTH